MQSRLWSHRWLNSQPVSEGFHYIPVPHWGASQINGYKNTSPFFHATNYTFYAIKIVYKIISLLEHGCFCEDISGLGTRPSSRVLFDSVGIPGISSFRNLLKGLFERPKMKMTFQVMNNTVGVIAFPSSVGWNKPKWQKWGFQALKDFKFIFYMCGTGGWRRRRGDMGH